MDVLSYVLAAPESRILATLAGWVCGIVVAGVLALVIQR